MTIRWIERKLNEYLNGFLKTDMVDYVIASDTDSVYINFKEIVDRFFTGKTRSEIVDLLDKLSKENIQPFLEKCYVELAERMNAYKQMMFMKRENIADRGLWTAKKRYILNVHDKEGVRYSEPKLKVMGIETVRSSTPAACRVGLKKALHILMNKDEKAVQTYIAEFREEFNKMSFEEIAFPRSVSDVAKYTVSETNLVLPKGTPFHVKGSLVYNHLLRTHNLTDRFEKIGNGDNIKFCYMRTPNPTGQNVVAAPIILPKEFGLNQYIDYETQFTKTFLDPMKNILDTIGWSVVKVSTLKGLF